jgi:hypothetical protein
VACILAGARELLRVNTMPASGLLFGFAGAAQSVAGNKKSRLQLRSRLPIATKRLRFLLLHFRIDARRDLLQRL